ncbi:hypothetical protein SAMN05444679_109232 [Variovorax sp. CF079]|nr:hypothetical protein SAMN05444679_109232 [Variovorax sp. CF079]
MSVMRMLELFDPIGTPAGASLSRVEKIDFLISIFSVTDSSTIWTLAHEMSSIRE